MYVLLLLFFLFLNSYALDSKSYHRFRAGKLHVADADYLLRSRGLAGRVVGACLRGLGLAREVDPTAVFPDPPPPPLDGPATKVAVVGVLPHGIVGPRVVINLHVPGASVHALNCPRDDDGGGSQRLMSQAAFMSSRATSSSGVSSPFSASDPRPSAHGFRGASCVEVHVPGVGPLRVCLPTGVHRLGVPEIQLEFPCVEVAATEGDQRRGASCWGASCFRRLRRRRSRRLGLPTHGGSGVDDRYDYDSDGDGDGHGGGDGGGGPGGSERSCAQCLAKPWLARALKGGANCACGRQLGVAGWREELEAVDLDEYNAVRAAEFEATQKAKRRQRLARAVDAGFGDEDGARSTTQQGGGSYDNGACDDDVCDDGESADASLRAPFAGFSRCRIDDEMDLEVARMELGPPQLQRFVAFAPKEVVLQNMIKVSVGQHDAPDPFASEKKPPERRREASTNLYCLWPHDAKEHDELQFHLPAVSARHLGRGDDHHAFVDPSLWGDGGRGCGWSDPCGGGNGGGGGSPWANEAHLERLFSPGWCLVSLPEDEARALHGPIAKASATDTHADPRTDPRAGADGAGGGGAGPRTARSDVALYYQVSAHGAKPCVKDFRDPAQTPFKLPERQDTALIAVLPPRVPSEDASSFEPGRGGGGGQEAQSGARSGAATATAAAAARGAKAAVAAGRSVRVRVPTSRDAPLHRQERRVSVPGVGPSVPVEVLASDVVVVPGLHGRPVHAFGFLPWGSWWDEDELATQQAVPRVDEVFFDFPCVELSPHAAKPPPPPKATTNAAVAKTKTRSKSPASHSTSGAKQRGAGSDGRGDPRASEVEWPSSLEDHGSLAARLDNLLLHPPPEDDGPVPIIDAAPSASLAGHGPATGATATTAAACAEVLRVHRAAARGAAAAWAAGTPGVEFYEGAPVHHQRFQVVADARTAAAAARGEFAPVDIPCLGHSTVALFPPESRAGETQLLFELPTLNCIEVGEGQVLAINLHAVIILTRVCARLVNIFYSQRRSPNSVLSQRKSQSLSEPSPGTTLKTRKHLAPLVHLAAFSAVCAALELRMSSRRA